MTLKPTDILDNGIRYLQRTLLGFDEDDPHIALAAPSLFSEQVQVSSKDTCRFSWPSLLVPHLGSLFIAPKDQCYIDRLPVELLREVFIYLIPDRHWRLEDTSPPQLLLVQICSYWRNVALAYPRLWSTFMIVYPIKRHIPMTKMWLEPFNTQLIDAN
ncbi:hypothetical protein J3R30DRAFT_120013 [Lentinula aciculospora]|uniref:F-box domain-containing protein n=1 Tax=Lentinula aciculospora TaxID=153920 RepID=A0A9W9AUL0_9AGAR|nr:hypothetical protein J3R30DRAFT_120013 [Lentinula aciculospora]